MATPRKAAPGGIGETVRTIIYAIVIALVVRTFAFEPFNIPSSSMVPTLLVGDYLFVSKYSYGYSTYSLPFGFDLFDGRVFGQTPKRGDVVVFKMPNRSSTDYGENFIKRTIGLPGDRIRVTNGLLYINDEPVKIEPALLKYAGDVYTQHLIETLPNGVRHNIDKTSDHGFYNDWPTRDVEQWALNPASAQAFEQDFKATLVTARDDPSKLDVKVPDGEFLMMGDNRDNSSDSRFWGYVPAKNLVGHAEILFFSTNGTAALWEVWKWPWAIRWSRLLNGVH
jgi:signal peptidase I